MWERAAGSGGVGEGEGGGVGALVAGFGSLFEGTEVLGGGHVDFPAGEEVLDGEDLEAGVFGVGDGFGLEEAGFGGLFAQGGGRAGGGDGSTRAGTRPANWTGNWVRWRFIGHEGWMSPFAFPMPKRWKVSGVMFMAGQ